MPTAGPAGKSTVSRLPTTALSGRPETHAAAKARPAASQPGMGDVHQGEEEDEIPWYVDPETYHGSKGRPGAGHTEASSSSISGIPAVLGKHSAEGGVRSELGPHSQQPQRFHLPEGLSASVHPASFAGELQTSQTPPWSLPIQHNELHGSRPGYGEAAGPQPTLPLPLLHNMDRISTSPRRAPLHFPAYPDLTTDVLSEARAAPLLASGEQFVHQISPHDQEGFALQREVAPRRPELSRILQEAGAQGAAESEEWQPPLRSYSDAWTQMVEV